MPLKCISNGSPLFAFDVESADGWEQLRLENKRNKHLMLPCCHAQVCLKTSKLGTRHFAHSRRGECATAPETAEHLLAKQRIIEGIRRAEWAAFVEQPGESLNYGPWIADVIAQKGSAKVAFEVQWSRQAAPDTRQRQERYKDSGVRGLWLFRQMDIPLAKETPAFRLMFDQLTSGLSVVLPSPGYANWMSARELADPRYWQQPVELSRFVHGALTGKLIFAPAIGKLLPLEIHTAPVDCWRCKKETRIVISLVFAAGRSFPGCADIELDIYELEKLPGGTGLLGTVLSSNVIAKHGVGPVKPRFSKTIGGKYMSNGCLHCDALQGQFFDHEVAYMSEKTFEVEALFQDGWADNLADPSSVNRWWFDPTI